MSHVRSGFLVLALAVPALGTEEKPAGKLTPAAEQYQALVKAHQDAMQAYSEALGKAKTYEERVKVFEEYPKQNKLSPKFLELAEKYPKDPVAFDALIWIVTNNVRSPAHDPARAKAVAILIRDHAQSEKLGPVCQNLANGYAEESAMLLTAILEKNPSKDLQAEACLALVQQYGRRLEIAERLDNPETLRSFIKAYGQEGVDRLKKADTANLTTQGERFSKQFADNYLGQMKPDRIAQLCQALSYSTDEVSGTLLRTLLEKDSRREVRGPASLTLAQVLKRRLEMTPGGETTAPQVLKECEKLLRRAADEFGDVKLASGGTVGDKAQVELDDILHLAVGKVAPDIEGEDQDGKKFKLSHYRGKVVLLDFWHQY